MGETESVKDQFSNALEDWPARLHEDEWYFVQLRERIVNPLSPGEAFDSIGDATQLTLEQDDAVLTLEAFELLMSLARHSDTREMPALLSEDWSSIIRVVTALGEYGARRADELARWYGRPAV